MKISLVFLLAVLMVGTVWGTTVDGQVVQVTNDGSTYTVKIQLKVDVAAGLGGATLSLSFNNADISFPASPAAGVDYTFHAFSGGSYSTATVTRPAANRVTANIEFNGGTATQVNTTYTDVVSITFTTINPAGASNLVWMTTQAIAEDQFTPWTVGTFTGLNTSPLPVQLSSFTAAMIQSSGGVLLKWTTLSETNNYGFEVQKSLEGSDSWQTIEGSFVAGNGTTLESHSYSYTDVNVTPGAWYYRLKQIDLDDAVHYSESIKPSGVTDVKEKEIPKEFALDQNYPNPFNPSTVINFALPRESKVSLEVYNLIGQRVAVLVNEVKPAGYHSLRFNGASFSSGIYFYSLVAGETKFLRKMVLVK